MKRLTAAITLLAFCATSIKAVLPVTDYGLTIQSEINHIQTFAKQVLQYEQELQIQINTLNTYEQEVLQVVAMGNPMTYISPIVGDVQQVMGGLAATERTLVGQYGELEAMTSPQTYQNTLNSVMYQFALPQWTGNVSALGVVTVPFQANYQFQASQYTVDVQTQKLIQSIEAQKNGIEALINTLTSQVSAGATTSQVQKLHASISALQATLASLDARENQLRSQALMFNQQVGAAQAMYRTAQGEQMAAAFVRAQENGISASGGVIQGNATEFGAVDDPNPQTNPLGVNGGGDPGLTSGNWYTGASGQNIGSTSSTGVSLPAATEIAQFGSTTAAMGQMVTVTDPSTGNSVTAPIVDVGPGVSAVAKGAIVDLTYSTARQLGMATNGSLPVQVSFPTKVQ